MILERFNLNCSRKRTQGSQKIENQTLRCLCSFAAKTGARRLSYLREASDHIDHNFCKHALINLDIKWCGSRSQSLLATGYC